MKNLQLDHKEYLYLLKLLTYHQTELGSETVTNEADAKALNASLLQKMRPAPAEVQAERAYAREVRDSSNFCSKCGCSRNSIEAEDACFASGGPKHQFT